MGFVCFPLAIMADAFGDDLFSVFDEEQTTSTKKKLEVPEKGYVCYGC